MTLNPDTSPYHLLPLLGFDTETDGVHVKNDHIITCNITYSMRPETPPEDFEKHDWLLKPVVPIPEGASAVHGISTEHAQEYGMDPTEALEAIHEHLASWEGHRLPLVAYNGGFDCSLLTYEWRRHGIQSRVKFNRVIDPYILDKQGFKYRPGKRTLTRLAELYEIKLVNAHAADADVLATLMLARKLPFAAPRLKLDRPIDEIHADEVRWASEQAASFQEYKRRTDPNIVINGEWPVKYGDLGS